MFIRLQARNLALIEEIVIEFGEGLNILTGETGAGKSILMNSIALAMGARASKDVIRGGAKEAYVELVFSVNAAEAARLRPLGITPEDDLVIFSRRITETRSLCQINGETVPASRAREAGDVLAAVHGQHETETLLSRAKHLEILDEFGGSELKTLREDVRKSVLTWQQAREKSLSFDRDERARARELDFLRYEIREIEEASLREGEEEELEARYKLMNHAKQILSTLNSLSAQLGYDERGGAGEVISGAVGEMRRIRDLAPDLAELEENLITLEDTLAGILNDLRRAEEEMTFDPEEFYETEQRLDQIRNIEAKYGNTVEDVLRALDDREAQVRALENYEEEKAQAEAYCRACEEQARALAEQLSAMRAKAAEEISRRMEEVLPELAFPHVQFSVELTRAEEPGTNGYDRASFLISVNEGQPVRPLEEVASGGELSRIMLGLRSLMAGRDEISTLIFDEIDAGISGETARRVAEKMQEIADGRQVLCITHLPQIAACADVHLLIEKTAEGGQTYTRVRPLTEEETVAELARLFYGGAVTDNALSSAREMRARAKRR